MPVPAVRSSKSFFMEFIDAQVTVLADQAKEQVLDAVRVSLEEYFTDRLEPYAKRLAPVRKVFKEEAMSRKTTWRTVGRRGLPWGAIPESSTGASTWRPSFYRGLKTTGRGTMSGIRNIGSKTSPIYQVKVKQSMALKKTRRLRQSFDVAVGPRARPRIEGSTLRGGMSLGGRWGSESQGQETTQVTYSRELYESLSSRGRYELRRGIAEYLVGRAVQEDTGRGGLIAIPAAGNSGHDVRNPSEGSFWGKGSTGKPGASSYKLQLGGRLRRSIHATEAVIDGNSVRCKLVAEAPYAIYVEYGTQKHGKAQPFMRPAIARAYREMPRYIGEAMRARLKEG